MTNRDDEQPDNEAQTTTKRDDRYPATLNPWAGPRASEEKLAALGPLARSTDRETAGTRRACGLVALRSARAEIPGAAPEKKPDGEPDLAEPDAAMAFARAFNRLDVSGLWPLLADDVRFASQAVLEELAGRSRVMKHLRGKTDTIRREPSARVYAEIGHTSVFTRFEGPRPCVLI